MHGMYCYALLKHFFYIVIDYVSKNKKPRDK